MRLKYLPLVLGLGFGLFNGCNLPIEKKEYSEIMHEPAVVSETIYSPARHGSGVSPSINTDFEIGLEFTNVNIPEKYAVVFRCQHGKFIIEDKKIWEKVSQGDSVDVSYRAVYKSRYQDVNDDGVIDLVSRTLIDYDFLNASPISKKK